MTQTGEPIEAPGAPPTGARHVLAVGGGRGGVGKSILSVNLSVYLAQLGRTVVLVDADPAGAELHTMLDVEPRQPAPPSEDTLEEDITPVETPIPGLLLLPQSYSIGSTVPVRPGRKPRWARRVRDLDVDYVVLDLGSGTQPATLDLFLSADVGMLVTAPEPPSVETTYRFCRAIFQRLIRRTLIKDRFKMRLVERAQQELPPLPAPLDLVHAIARYDSSVGELAAAELGKLRPRLAVNWVRHRADSELGSQMCAMSKRYLGMELDYVGHVEQDESVALSIVHQRPLLIANPTTKSARNIERIARRVLALATTREANRPAPAPIPTAPSEPNLYEMLGTPLGATDEEIRRAYKRQSAIYRSHSLPLTSLLSGQGLLAEQARIEEANDTLLDPLRRRAYDVSTFPEEQTVESPRDEVADAALEAEREMLREHLSREITPETEFTGDLLRKVRESQGVELDDIAMRTKISGAHLDAIEDENFNVLPAIVYTRGFVREIAKHLNLDPAQVTKTYLRRMRRALAESEQAP